MHKSLLKKKKKINRYKSIFSINIITILFIKKFLIGGQPIILSRLKKKNKLNIILVLTLLRRLKSKFSKKKINPIVNNM